MKIHTFELRKKERLRDEPKGRLRGLRKESLKSNRSKTTPVDFNFLGKRKMYEIAEVI